MIANKWDSTCDNCIEHQFNRCQPALDINGVNFLEELVAYMPLPKACDVVSEMLKVMARQCSRFDGFEDTVVRTAKTETKAEAVVATEEVTKLPIKNLPEPLGKAAPNLNFDVHSMQQHLKTATAKARKNHGLIPTTPDDVVI